MSRLFGLGARRMRRLRRRDDGLSLMEVLVAMVIIGGVMASASLFFIGGLRSTGGQSQRQVAVALANEALEQAQGLAPQSLTAGRSKAEVQSLLASPGASTITALDQTGSGNYDPTATSDSPQALPATTTQTVNGDDYTVTAYVNLCWLKGTKASGSCTATEASGLTKMFRVSVDVSWTPTAGQSCSGYAPNRCDYVASTLIDPSGDPVFTDTTCNIAITGINPQAIVVGSTQNITLTGTGFADGAAVSIASKGGIAGNVVSVTDTQLVFSLAAGNTPGSYVITVLNPNGCTGTSVVKEDAAPTITKITTTCGNPSTLTITGTGFQNGAILSVTAGVGLGGTIGPLQVLSATSATATLNAGLGASVFLLTNPDGGSVSASATVSACLSVGLTTAITTCIQHQYGLLGLCTKYSTTITTLLVGLNLGTSVSASLAPTGGGNAINLGLSLNLLTGLYVGSFTSNSNPTGSYLLTLTTSGGGTVQVPVSLALSL